MIYHGRSGIKGHLCACGAWWQGSEHLTVWKGLRSTPGGAAHPALWSIFLGMAGVPKWGCCSLDSWSRKSRALDFHLLAEQLSWKGHSLEGKDLSWCGFKAWVTKNWFWLVMWNESIFTNHKNGSIMWVLNCQTQMLQVECVSDHDLRSGSAFLLVL